jgi:hypothetical protein
VRLGQLADRVRQVPGVSAVACGDGAAAGGGRATAGGELHVQRGGTTLAEQISTRTGLLFHARRFDDGRPAFHTA